MNTNIFFFVIPDRVIQKDLSSKMRQNFKKRRKKNITRSAYSKKM